MSQHNPHPIAGIDYPRTLQEFDEWFSTEKASVEYIQQLRWPEGFRCPSCYGRKGWLMATGLIRCSTCKQKISIIAGTLFQGTRKPLRLWFQAMWYITSQKFGGNALGLKRILGLGSYQTAWIWLHKMRCAMVRPSRERLSGNIEVDETLIGGEEKGGKRGRGAGRKSIVVIAVEVHKPKGFGRVRMQRVTDASGANLSPFVQNTVTPGSVVHTDSWGGYNEFQKIGYIHKTVNISNSGDPAHVVMPGVHRIASLLKRWLLGTHQGAISGKHLDSYLDEYAFRFNRRTSKTRGLLFYRLLQQAVAVAPLTYKVLVHGQQQDAEVCRTGQ
ncbi:MAG: IS1595 family transposase [Bacteroidetes bacterium]|nr:MAG: IS1595 family transposase [Bacteroidota bacterium]